jgi:hypothetical protein
MNPLSFGMMGPTGLPTGVPGMIPILNGMQGYPGISIPPNSDFFKMFTQSQTKHSDSTSQRQAE